MGDRRINSFMQVALVEGQVFADALLEGEPVVLNGVEVGRVRGQEFLGAASRGNEATRFGRLMEAGVVIEHSLSSSKDRHQTVFDIRLEEGGIAIALEHKRGDEGVLVEGLNNTHALGAMPRLLPPARLALGAPPIRPDFVVIYPGLIEIHQLCCGDTRQLGAKLLPQLLIALGISKGLFLCV